MLVEALVNRDGRKPHRQATGQHHAAAHRVDELWGVAVAGVVVAAGVRNADDRTVQRSVGEPRTLDERLAQEQRKTLVAIARQAFAHAGGAGVVFWIEW
jgi:hypothetical protein